ncbi:baseplate multidomain protein megatron [Jannaschia rubra]|uniref:Host specificity protein n=1 Tax=Jannaschia rubra TaxID=282197 RepID=A0A0M6XT18_9RHOB|nr:glycoside hydrolase TIM-barrel-like domain-containing protein [Jannaschia rubra]CTQ34230.1 hypothetical protein JAN5088_03023 [Jannaschia rubra]SFG20024.1 Putative phage tail protein [Jannaschia rubra]
MATLVLGAVGAAVGGSLGGSILGVSGAVIGRAVGATVGRVIDQSIMGSGSEAVEHGRMDRLRLTGASEGSAIPRVVGRVRVGGQVIWATRFKEHRESTGGSGKGGPKPPKQTTYSYSISLAMALCEGEIARVGRIWADGSEIARRSIQMRVYRGTEDQLPDALIEAVDGRGNAPAFRGTAYVVIEDLDLTPFGNRVPHLTFEVLRHARAEGQVASPAELIEGVALVPGTGEYALATTAVHYDHGGGAKESANINTAQTSSDFRVAMRDLTEEMPNLKSVSLVVSWFGDDLRCGDCAIRPKVEQTEVDGTPQPWNVSGVRRSRAGRVPALDGRPVYGGTPSDASVIEAIRHLNKEGLDVTFYPFILMEQMAGNGLPDPWGGEEQAALPWRGRITTTRAAGMDGSTDRSAAAEAEVDRFFGRARAGDFAVRVIDPILGPSRTVVAGPEDDWSYRRFILHYATLCAEAGGVEAFCIGSEMRALTQIRGAGDSFPAVAAMRSLAAEVRKILPDAKIGYAADWSEYFGYHPQDTGNVHFHLDPLWADGNVDFVGIDNYMPMADWRAGRDHLDAGAGSVGNIDYLRQNVEGGEGFDWSYPTPEARDAQRRVPITDGEHKEPWVWRYKDIAGWWGNLHHDRIDGVRSDLPTAWLPGSKPVRFTEFGCAAIDKGANQPNRFFDEKSSESGLPFYSNGRRDDAMQVQYLRAFIDHWRRRNDAEPMVDLAHSFAWAWDTRPWPYFPELTDLWSDGVNYARGHWISGRTGNQPLATVIAEICRASGLEAFDVSGVHGVVRGYVMTNVQNARADLQPLMIAHGIEARERNGVLVFSMRADAVERAVSDESLVRRDGPIIARHRAPEAEIARRVIVHHVDAAGDFEVRIADAMKPGTGSLPVSETELPLSLTKGEAHGLAERFLSEAGIVRDVVDLDIAPSNRSVGVGDLLRIDDTADLWRVDRLDDAGARRIKAVRTERAIFEPSDEVEDGSGRTRPLAPLPVDATYLELPLLTGQEVAHAPWVAVAARPWPGAVALHASIDGSGYRFNRLIEAPSLVGATRTVLEPARPGIWDRGDELLVQLDMGALSSVSETALLAGANAVAIGDGSIRGWEVLQFRDARLVAPGVWALSNRLRGQRGTEHAMRKAHPVGSRVVFLDETLTQIDLPRERVGLDIHYLCGPANLPIDNEAFSPATQVAMGEGLRPYAPVHLRCRREGARLLLNWVRRSRLDMGGWDIADVPLGEASERYLVQVVAPEDVVVVETSVSRSEVSLDVGTWGSRDDLRVRVAQVSDEVGPGQFAEVAVG